MTLTLAQRTQLRKRAAKEAARTAPAALMDGLTQYELMLAKLQQDGLRLRQVQSLQHKALVKAELIGEYKPYVEGVLAEGRGAQDDVLMTVMVWRLDAGAYTEALDIAKYALEHGLKMTDKFTRTTGCAVAEVVADAALKEFKAGESFPIEVLARTAALTDNQDMPDEVRAKLKLALGKAKLRDLDLSNPGQPGQIQEGIDFLKSAIGLNSHCGGKKDLEAAERLLKKIAGTAG
ncbi:phage terminase small subunit [Pseudomonas huaxiensis]|uniref:phage terminase small subunit n=1 Tax=Pseudomonas huaxiensis TaxID=2213017 RepID=UPI000DA670B8|nr:phage terminase small subunit [Pseudomonas huaxiensis]